MFRQMNRFAAVLAVAATFALATGPADATQKRQYGTIFAEAISSQYDLQVAGTYEAKNEVLVKLRNGNQYAVPVAPGSDLSVWRTNELVVLTITQGLMIGIEPAGSDEPGLSYAILNETDVMDGIPDDVLVREVTLVTEVSAINAETGAVTFVAGTGDSRTAILSDPALLKDIKVNTGDLLELTYFDAIDITKK